MKKIQTSEKIIIAVFICFILILVKSINYKGIIENKNPTMKYITNEDKDSYNAIVIKKDYENIKNQIEKLIIKHDGTIIKTTNKNKRFFKKWLRSKKRDLKFSYTNYKKFTQDFKTLENKNNNLKIKTIKTSNYKGIEKINIQLSEVIGFNEMRQKTIKIVVMIIITLLIYLAFAIYKIKKEKI